MSRPPIDRRCFLASTAGRSQILAGLVIGAMLGSLPGAAAAQDAAAGNKAFNQQCRVCHQVAAGAASPMGPNLLGVVGRKAAADPAFAYSAALKTAGSNGLVWSESRLDEFLTQPTKMIPGSKMPTAVSSAPTRAGIIAYLATLKP